MENEKKYNQYSNSNKNIANSRPGSQQYVDDSQNNLSNYSNNSGYGGGGKPNFNPSYDEPTTYDKYGREIVPKNNVKKPMQDDVIAKPGQYLGNHGVMAVQGKKSAYDLYCTPHQYIKIKAPIKRAIGYKK